MFFDFPKRYFFFYREFEKRQEYPLLVFWKIAMRGDINLTMSPDCGFLLKIWIQIHIVSLLKIEIA